MVLSIIVYDTFYADVMAFFRRSECRRQITIAIEDQLFGCSMDDNKLKYTSYLTFSSIGARKSNFWIICNMNVTGGFYNKCTLM